MIIDVFNHIYPKEYFDALPKPLPPMVTLLSSDNPAEGKGKAITDIDYRISQMKKFGIDKQILSLPGPTLDDLPPNIPVKEFNKIYKAANEGIAKIADKSHGRFKGIATVSLLDVEEAVEETERSVKDLGLLVFRYYRTCKVDRLIRQSLSPYTLKSVSLGAACGFIHRTSGQSMIG